MIRQNISSCLTTPKRPPCAGSGFSIIRGLIQPDRSSTNRTPPPKRHLDPLCVLELEYNLGCSTRRNKYKLLNCTFCHDLRKYYFSARIINIWNSLPNCVVDVSTINQFNARLDKFWMHQDVLYDYTADLTGIGDRSVHVTKDV